MLRTSAISAIAVAAAMVAMGLPAIAYPADVVAEDWEGGLGAWTVTGTQATQDCTVAHSGSCSLRLYPNVTNTHVTVERTFSEGIEGRSAVSTQFRGSSTSGDTDLDFIIDLAPTGTLVVHLTGPTGNNRASIREGSGTTSTTVAWPSANTWYEARVWIDEFTDKARLDVYEGSSLVGSTSEVAIPASATSIAAVRFQAVPWNSPQNTYHLDDLKFLHPTAEEWEDGLAGWTVTGTQATQDCATAVNGGCSLRLYPDVANTYVRAEKAFNAPLSQKTVVSTYFKGAGTTGNTDTNVVVKLGSAGHLFLHLTGPVGNNNVQLTSSHDGVTRSVGTWPSANTWYEVRVTIDPVLDVAYAELLTAGGTSLGSTLTNPSTISSSASTVSSVVFEAVPWNSPQNTFHYDALKLTESVI